MNSRKWFECFIAIPSIASFERIIVSGNSHFDRYYFSGKESAISDLAKSLYTY